MSNIRKKNILLENPEYFDFENGLWTGKKPPYQSVTVIRNTNFTNSGKIDYSNVAVLEVESKQFQSRKLIKGDIIIERSGGGPKQPVGRVVYFDKDDGDYSFSNFTSRIRVINDELNSKFVFYYLMYFYDAGNTFEMQAQTTGIRNLDFSKYKKSVSFPLLPLPEQRKIAYILNTVQKAIEQQDKLIRTTTELKKALMQKLFTEGTKGEKQKQTEIGLVPESWEVENLGLHSNIVTSFPTFAKASAKYSTKEGKYEIHYLKVSDMNLEGNEISFITSNNTFYTNDKADFKSGFIKPSSLVFPKRGAAIATNKKRITTKHSILDPNLIGVEPYDEINIKFLYYFFETFDLSNLQDNNVIPQLNKHNVAGVKFPLPNIQEQELIVKTIDTISQKINSLKTKKHILSALFKTLLHELMTGERRVLNLDFEGLTDAHDLKKSSNQENHGSDIKG